MMMSSVLPPVVEAFSDLLIHEWNLLTGTEGQVEWIENELRLMRASMVLVETMEQPGEDAVKWAEEAAKVFREVEDVNDIFLHRSRRGPFRSMKSLMDRYKFGMKLEHIKVQIREVHKKRRSQQRGMVPSSSRDVPPSSQQSASTQIAFILDKVDAILCQNMLFHGGVIRRVEQIRDEFIRLQGILQNVKAEEEPDERSQALIDEVRQVLDFAVQIFRAFTSEREPQLQKSGNFKIPLLASKDIQFGKDMELINGKIQGLNDRMWTYGIGDSEWRERSTQMVRVFDFENLSRATYVTELFSVYTRTFLFLFPPPLPNFHSLPSVGDQFESISRDFKLMQALIKDVDGMEGLDQRVRVWVEEIKYIASHVEDLVNNPEQENRKGILKRLTLAKKIKKINDMIHNVSERKWTYDIGKIEGRKSSSSMYQSPYRSPSQQQPSTSDAVHNPGMDGSSHLWEQINCGIWSFVFSFIKGLTNVPPVTFKELGEQVESIKWEKKLMNALFNDVEQAEEQDERAKIWIKEMQGLAEDAQRLIDTFGYVENERKGAFKKIVMIHFMIPKMISRIKNGIYDISRLKRTYAIGGIKRRGHSSIHETQQEMAVSISEIAETPNASRPAIFLHEIVQKRRAAKGLTLFILEEFLSVAKLEKSVELIKREWTFMDALSKDVGGKEGLNDIQRVWVKEIQAVAEDARKYIDEYNEITRANWLSIKKRFKVFKKIKMVMSKIQDITEKKMAWGIEHIKGSKELRNILRSPHQTLPPSFTIKEPGIINFYDDLQAVMSQLLTDNENRCIISIVGMEGIGKTTLAKLIYDNNTIECHFPRRVWLSIPQDSRALLKDIEYQIMRLRKWKGKHIKKEDPIQMLKALLIDIRYLIVLDGVNIVEVWDKLKEAFSSTSNGSRIILTTRSIAVAKYADPNIVPHKLHLLSDDDSWALFTHTLTIPQGLRELSRKSVIECGGLPQAIVKLREQVERVESTSEAWIELLQNRNLNEEPWYINWEKMRWGLPLYLRPCLSYFEQFQMEFEIPVRRLIVLWIAESVVRQRSGDEDPPEFIAKKYLTELMDRNMVQVTEKKLNGEIRKCRLPHALRKFPSASKNIRLADHYNSSDASFVHIHGDTPLPSDYKDVISFMSFDTRTENKSGEELGNFLNRCISTKCFLSLRVLDLERVFRPKLPKALGKLIRLRYLGLRWTYLETLPSFISKLLNLQTLDVKHTSISTLPRSIWKMHHLRHLFLNESYRCRLAPRPHGESLTNLQTLWGVFIDEDSPVKDGLDRLLNVKKLGLASRLMSSQRQAMLSRLKAVADWLKKLKQLQSLRLKSYDEKGHPWYLPLEDLSGHTNLNSIYLLGRINRQFVASGFPLGVTDLTLSASRLKMDPMRILKYLINLKILRLLCNSYIGKQMLCTSGGFLQLRVLNLWKLEQLEKWEVEEGALPSLRDLDIRACKKLEMFPGGLLNLETLQKLTYSEMPETFANTVEVN